MNKIILASTAAFLGLISTASAFDNLKWFADPRGNYQVKAPSSWIQNFESDYFSIVSKNDESSITMNAYFKEGGSLEEFSEYRFSSVQEFYLPQTEIQKIRDGVFREFEGVWPGESKPTYCVVAAVEIQNMYISIGIVTNREEFNKNRKHYLDIIESIRKSS